MAKAVGAKKARPVTWIIFYLIVPILFAAVMAIGVLQLIGFNVVGKIAGPLESIPMVKHFMGVPPAPPTVPAQVAALDTQMEAKSVQIKTLEFQVKKLQAQLDAINGKLKTTQTALKNANLKVTNLQATQVQASEQASIYSNMDANQAAVILVKLPFRTQVLTLKAMNPSDQASILAQMSATAAAKLLQAGA